MSHGAHSIIDNIAYTPTSARYGRIFPAWLPRAKWEEDDLKMLGIRMTEIPTRKNEDNPGIPAAYTYFGQFIDHDLTLDLVSSFERDVDPPSLRNFRTAALELDSVYGGGPHGAAFLYEGGGSGRLRLGRVSGRLPGKDLPDPAFDLPRWPDHVPVVADGRNDENLFVNQLQVALIRFHNRIYDALERASHRAPFAEAQRQVRLHYQHVVLKDYLPLIVGQQLIDDIQQRSSRCLYDPENIAAEAFMPIEFAAAAFRFGHVMVRDQYQINHYSSSDAVIAEPSAPAFIPIMVENSPRPPFNGDRQQSRVSLIGGPVRQRDIVDWSFMLGDTGQKARSFRPLLCDPLRKLPAAVIRDNADIATLAIRNLLRGNTLRLVEGRAAARYLALLLNEREQGFVLAEEKLWPAGFEEFRGRGCPLWYYILREAEEHGEGLKLGPLGGWIVAETIIGVLQKDPESILTGNAGFKPAPEFLIKDRFDLAALLQAAGFRIGP